MTDTFLGVSILAVVPSTAEYVNAIQFSLQDNVALSIEIGNSGAVQIALIQIPVLVLFSAIWNHAKGLNSFILIFPVLDFAGVLFSVLIVNYVSIEGKSNYFLGTSLIVIWILILASFFFAPNLDGLV